MINFKLDRVGRSVNKVSRALEDEVLDLFNVSEIKSKKMKIWADRENRILKSAQRTFAGHRFCRSSIQMISDDVSIAKADIHNYFSSKEKISRSFLERIFTVWLDTAENFENSNEPRAALHDYMSEKMEISHLYLDVSKVWATEVIHSAPIIGDFRTSALDDWTNGRTEAIRCLTKEVKIRDLGPHRILNVIWPTTQPCVNFAHLIETLNDDTALLINRWQQARDAVLIASGQGFRSRIKG